MKEAVGGTFAEITERLPEKAARSGKKTGGGTKKTLKITRTEPDPCVHTAMITDELDAWHEPKQVKAKKSAGTAKKAKGRAKARSGSEKLTPAALFRKLIAFGKIYQVEKEQDYLEAARIYAEEAALIDQMRDRIAEDGLTVEKTYKTGSVEVAHPLLSELPRHVESANRCLATIGSMIEERGAKKERAARDLDQFRLH